MAIDPAILDRLRLTESSGNRLAVNPVSGAEGPYQFMPATTKAMGGFDPFDETVARQKAEQYLTQLVAQNGGDIRKALAAYGGFKTKDPTAYVNKVLGTGGNMGVDQSTINGAGMGYQMPQPTPEQRKSMAAATAGMADVSGQMVDVSKKQEALGAEKAAALAAPRAAIADRAAQEVPAPKLEEVKDYQRPTMDPKEMHDAFGAMMIASMLVGFGSRTPYNNVMTAMTNVMQGFMKGDENAVKESMQVYDKNLAAIKERNAAKQTEVNDLWKKKENDLKGLQLGLEMIAAKYDDPQLALTAREKSLTAMWKQYESTARATEKAIEQGERLQQHGQDYMQKERQFKQTIEQQDRLATEKLEAAKVRKGASDIVHLNPQGMKVASWEKLLFGKLPSGLGNASAGQKAEVTNAAADLGEKLGLTPEEQAMLPVNNKIKMKAVDGLVKWGANLEKSSEQVQKSLDLALTYAEKMTPSDIKLINSMIIAGEKQFGSGPAAGYAAAMMTVQREYGRLMMGPMSNAMLPVEAVKATNDLISTANSIDQLREVRTVMFQDAKFTTDSVSHQVESLRNSVQNLGKSGAAPAGGTAAPYADPEKERRYQEWKASHAGQ